MKKYGLIGFPLGHSFSRKFFSEKFDQEKIDARYDLYEIDDISKFSLLTTDEEIMGLNVTIPYKEKIIPYLDELDEVAAKIGAVNVIKFIRAENKLKLRGFNSDAIGFENSIKPYLKSYHQKALILGTGGASKAINYVLTKLEIEVLFVSRTKSEKMITYSELNASIIDEYKLIINASPIGTFPHTNECPHIPYEFLTQEHLLYDLVYNPAETLFMKKGLEKGAKTLNGEAMLHGQALAAWNMWNQ
jgi:shikimate dehydrogenase